ncbi:MAG: IS66 family transposase [Ktedonobacterales bacterium]
MTTEAERITQLEAELAMLQAYVRELLVENVALKRRLAQDSHNSSKPPASDGLARRPRSLRRPSGKKPGGQPGHPGHTLALVATPDVVRAHIPAVCGQCQVPLAGVPGVVVERRQVRDLPPLRLEVTEHQALAVTCPACQAVTRGVFPAAVRGPTQYGPRVRALAVYLHHYQVVPQERTHEAVADLFGCSLSAGSVAQWVEQAGETLAPTVARLADLVAAGPHQHADETGLRIGGKLHWLHVNSTRHLTHLAWHPKRGAAATAAIGIWPRFHGRATHDRWASYDAYRDCAHSLCGAHLLRELALVAEQDGQPWAAALADLLRGMDAAAHEWRTRRTTRLPAEERNAWIAQYHVLLAQGFAAQPPPPVLSPPRRRRGRPKQSPAKNLLDALLQQSDRVLAFVDDLTIPFTNNQAERDLRMAKVQQKIAGTFRSEAGATAYCRLRSYLSTMRKQGHGMLDALSAVFAERPLPVAWGS